MVVNFALLLSFDGISLLRRTQAGWSPLGEVPLAEDDLESRMASLLETGLAVHKGARRVALIIPNEQIRYLDLPDPGGDHTARDAAIRAALDGATPYAVEELVYDHARAEGRLMIAAVARETLEEAESFARAHGFRPTTFLAIAPDGAFAGCVFFGIPADWDGPNMAERPAHAIRVLLPSDEVAQQSAPAQPDPQAIADRSGTAPGAGPTGAPVARTAKRLSADVQARDTAGIAPAADGGTAATRPAGTDEDGIGPEAADKSSEGAATGAEDDDVPVLSPAALAASARVRDARAAKKDTATEPSRPDGKDAGPAGAEHAGRPTPPIAAPDRGAPAPAAPVAAPQDTPPLPSVRFASIRAVRDEAGNGAPPLAPPTSDIGDSPSAPRFTPVADAADKPQGSSVTADRIEGTAEPARKDEKTRSATAARFFSGRGEDTAKGAPPSADESLGVTPRPPVKPASPENRDTGAQSAGADAETRGRRTRGRITAMRETDAARAATAAAPDPRNGGFATTEDERARMTVFGARNREPVGGKPRFLGLMLTAALLLFLVGVAAWASVFLDDGIARFFRPGDENRAVASLPEPVAATEAPMPDAGSSADPGVEAIAPAPSTAPESAEDDSAAPPTEFAARDDTAAPVEDGPAPRATPRGSDALSPEQATATYAATGIWQRAPAVPREPPAGGTGDVYVASIDPAVRKLDAVALPDPGALADTPALQDPGLPPPPGMTFDFDDRGLVRATPEGALSPEGLRIHSGRPAEVPPRRSAALAAPRTVPEDALQELERVRPRTRPDDIVEQRERARLRGFSVDELAAIRPLMRPRTAQEEAQAADPATTATAEAVRTSLLPVSRPRNMDTIVQRAAQGQDREAVRSASAAAVAPRTVQPDVPSSANVARAATVRNAIGLNRVSLIGVYGTSSNRRALVRMPNGQYEKVKVGDRLDGGRVTAISASQLRYQKGGRTLSLDMPRG